MLTDETLSEAYDRGVPGRRISRDQRHMDTIAAMLTQAWASAKGEAEVIGANTIMDIWLELRDAVRDEIEVTDD